jgi:hypothetical protein
MLGSIVAFPMIRKPVGNMLQVTFCEFFIFIFFFTFSLYLGKEATYIEKFEKSHKKYLHQFSIFSLNPWVATVLPNVLDITVTIQ